MRRLAFEQIQTMLARTAAEGSAAYDLGDGAALFFMRSYSSLIRTEYMDVHVGSGPSYPIFREADTNRFEAPLTGSNTELATRAVKWLKPWLRKLDMERKRMERLGFRAETPLVRYSFSLKKWKVCMEHRWIEHRDGIHMTLNESVDMLFADSISYSLGDWTWTSDPLDAFKAFFKGGMALETLPRAEMLAAMNEDLRMELVER
ncbi:MAG: hypothetical protein J6Y62_01730 [Clostridia bacterium]|nr:hypothetical protein [Clostridia bacterium]